MFIVVVVVNSSSYYYLSKDYHCKQKQMNKMHSNHWQIQAWTDQVIARPY